MILIDFSHILTFSMLFIAAVFDVRSELGDVPDEFMVIAVTGGILLHSAQSYLMGSWEPIMYCLMAGGVFSVYGWAAYWKGMWGGADAFALSALGFGAPFLTLSTAGVMRQGLNLFINLVLIASIYSIVFSAIRAYRTEDFRKKFFDSLSEKSRRISIELGLGLAVFGIFDFLIGVLMFSLIVVSVVLMRFLRVVEEHALYEEVDAEDLEGGEVVKQEKSDKITGVTEEEIKELDGPVQVMHGLRFVPVFPAALLLTDAGFSLVKYVIFA